MSNLHNQIEYDEHPLNEYMDFTFSSFGSPSIDKTNSQIIVPIRSLKIYKGFPEFDKDVMVLEGNIIFDQVMNSVRSIKKVDKEQISDSDKTNYKIDDGPFTKVSGEVYTIYLGGPTFEPSGWIEWEIDAVNIKIEAKKTRDLDS